MDDTGGSQQKRKGPPAGKRHTGGKKGAHKPLPLLVDYRAVWRQEEEKDKGEVQKRLRKMLIDDPEKYQDRMIRLEGLNRQTKAARAGVRDEAGEVKSAILPVESEELAGDVGEERVTELIERLLGEWEQ